MIIQSLNFAPEKKTNCNSCCKRLFARTDLFATHLKFTALMGVSCNLMFRLDAGNHPRCIGAVQGAGATVCCKRHLRTVQLLFQSLKRCPGWGDVAIRSTIPSYSFHPHAQEPLFALVCSLHGGIDWRILLVEGEMIYIYIYQLISSYMFFQLALPLILGKVWAQMNLSSVAPSTGLLQWFLAPKCFMYFFWYILIWDVDIFGIRLLIWLDLIRFDLTCRMRASFRILRDMCLEKEGTNPTKFTAQFTSHSTVLKHLETRFCARSCWWRTGWSRFK